MDIPNIVSNQRAFYNTHTTKEISYRKSLLKKLLSEINNRENDIISALNSDFRKPKFETILSEVGVVQIELRKTISKISSWAKPKTVMPTMLNYPSWSKIYKEPYGTVLIIGPWNYPFQLIMSPLIGAVAAGNTVVLKPSELTPATSGVIKEIVKYVFDQNHVTTIEGGIEVSKELLAQKWDYIFFTGSVSVGRVVAEAAAPNLTPTTLELGGKSPCIIDETANIKLAAKRLVWGKFLNNGQTCIAPDFVLIHNSIKAAFVKSYIENIERAYGKSPQESNDLARIINLKNFKRLKIMLEGHTLLYGGITNENELYISPTLVDNPDLHSDIMKEEIFGPIMPIITYDNESEMHDIISRSSHPLSLYIFSSRNSLAKSLINKYAFGGGVINDTMVHFANSRLPFGGIGNSGMGSYHGKHSFDTFVHEKSVTRRFNYIDPPVRYAPYKGKTKLLKWMLRWLG